MKDLVIGIDSSTQSTKAIAWDAAGHAVAEGRAPIALYQPQPGWAEQDVENWWQACCTALTQLGTRIDMARVAAVAISNQRETVAFIDKDGRAVRPAMVWLDERAEAEVQRLDREFGGERLHRITGRPLDVIPVVYRVAWMTRHEPENLARCWKILDVHSFLAGRLTGHYTASWTSADPFAIFDIHQHDWSGPILDYLGLTAERFADHLPPASLIGTVTPAAAALTGLVAGTPLVTAGGDGQCAGLGVNATRPGVFYLNLGTAIVAGIWAADPTISLNWRSMLSPTGKGYFLECCQRGGAFFLNWFVDNFAGGRADPAVFNRLEQQAATIPVGSEGVYVCPYISGVMDPYWDSGARASFHGLGPGHTTAHLYRAILEALTLETARGVAAMRASGLDLREIIAVGGGSNNRLWLQMHADTTSLPVKISESLEASALGAGITAAVYSGWYPDFDAAATAMCRTAAEYHPDTALQADWEVVSQRQASAYQQQKPPSTSRSTPVQ
ncbi:MAG TPA: FGGY-family carbohydrate kinase [Thiolinea sp.]|nr:FGGY-family carbohydrate kinase [Thiolinea sp.]